MNILLAIESLETGGAEIFVKNLAISLAARHRVFLLLTSSRHASVSADVPGVVLINPLRINLPGKDHNQYYWLYQLNYILQQLQFRYIIVRHAIDVVHSHLFHTDFKIFKWLGNKKMPWVITMHGCYESYLFRKEGETHSEAVNELYRKRMELLLARVDYVTMASDKNRFVFDYVKARPGTEVINLGVPVRDIKKREVDSIAFAKKNWVIGMVSRGIEAKGWDVAIEAFLKWRTASRQFNSELRLVYSETDYMRTLRTRYQQEAAIQFIGFKSDVLAEMSQMDVLLFPSRFASESQPITIIEAMSAGLPVIATSIGEIPRMLGINVNPSGICIAAHVALPEQIDQTTQALFKLKDDSTFYAKQVNNAYLNFRAFSIEVSAEKFSHLYQSLIDTTS